MSNIKRATEDIYDGVFLAFRKGDVVPDGNRLATKDNTAGEDSKAAKAAMSDRAGEAAPAAPAKADAAEVVNAKE